MINDPRLQCYSLIGKFEMFQTENAICLFEYKLNDQML